MILLRIFLLASLGFIAVVRPEAVREKLIERDATDISSRIIAVLASQGIEGWTQEVAFEPSLRAQVVNFRNPGCLDVAKAIPFNITLNSDAFLVMNGAQDWSTRMIHLEHSGAHLSQARLLAGFLNAKFLNVFGNKQKSGSRTAVILAAPPGCEAALDVDLSTVWDRLI